VSDPGGLDEQRTPKQAETMVIERDFGDVRLDDYAGVIMAANYTSVRLRYFQPPQQPADAPAVSFFARAMQNAKIVKGALCHGLWILTPRPDLLRGRRVTCHEVVRADVLNAGAVCTPSPEKIVADGDLVTGYSSREVHEFIEAIARVISGRHVERSGDHDSDE